MRQDISHSFRVRIPWKIGDTVSSWNEVCIGAIEEFGLPGDKYSTELTSDFMDFYFAEEKDAIIFSLKWQ